MASKKLSYEALREEYAALWGSIEPRASKAADVEATAKKIVAKKTRYTAVEKATSVPWYVVGIIHAMESQCNFGTHLHNGDPLADRTVQVPAGRPKGGAAPFAWKDSAIDALTMHDLDKIVEWPIERICFELERYNGFGYRNYHPDVLSPYLWSGTNHYSRGKYIEDGEWSGATVSGQSGAIAILKRMMELSSDVAPVLSTQEAPQSVEEVVATPAEAFPRATPPSPMPSTLQNSRTVFGSLIAAIGGFLAAFKEIIADAASQVVSLAPARDVLSGFGLSGARIALVVTVAGCLYAIYARLEDASKGHVK